jgi:nucleotide-binding universal stress UspA family protein
MSTDLVDKKSTANRRKIVVGADGSELSLRAVEWAARQAQLTGTLLELVLAFGSDYVYIDRDEAQEYMQKDVDEAMRRAEAVAPGLEVTSRIFDRLPAIPLIEESKQARLLVVGSRGRGGFASRSLTRFPGQVGCCDHAATSATV